MVETKDILSVIIPKPRLTPFLRTKLRMIGIHSPYDFIDTILTSRKTGYDLAIYYDTWDNLVDNNKITPQNQAEILGMQDTLLTTLTQFIDFCPLTSFLLHTEIKTIDELPDGLQINYLVDREQIENTHFNQPPEGYVKGTLVGF